MISSNRIALFIDGPNLFATAKTIGFDIDYKRRPRNSKRRGQPAQSYRKLTETGLIKMRDEVRYSLMRVNVRSIGVEGRGEMRCERSWLH